MNEQSFHAMGFTDTGIVRPVNEDHILVGRFVKNHGYIGLEFAGDDDFLAAYGMLFAVSDGIGGEKAGEVASRITLQAMERHFYGNGKLNTSLATFSENLLASAKRANDTVIQAASSRPEFGGMGCTLSGICLSRSGYLVFNAGDSRVYRLRSGILKQLTEDDTFANIAVRVGKMTYEEALSSNARHTITNSIGTPDFNLKITEGPDLRDGDKLLICSDGLHDLVPIGKMEEILFCNNIEDAGKRLVAEAKNNGGHDNISLILIHYGELKEPDEDVKRILDESLALDNIPDIIEKTLYETVPVVDDRKVEIDDYQI